MRYSLAAAAIAGVASAAWSQGEAHQGGDWSHGGQGSWGPPTNGTGEVYVTEVVTAFTTFCPVATVITHGSQTYSASASATITITGPVTITKPISTSVVVQCQTCSSPVAPKPSSSAPAVTTSKSTPAGPIGTGSSSKSTPAGPIGTGSASKSTPAGPVATGTRPVGSAPVGTGSATKSATGTAPIATYTGAASKFQAGAVGALAVVGLVAAL